MFYSEHTPLLTGTPSIAGLLGTSTPPTLEAITNRVGILSQHDLNTLLTMPQIADLADTNTLKSAIHLASELLQETQNRECKRRKKIMVSLILSTGLVADLTVMVKLISMNPHGIFFIALGLFLLQVILAAGLSHTNGGPSLCRKYQDDKHALVTPLMQEHLNEAQQASLNGILSAEVSAVVDAISTESVLEQLSGHIKMMLANMAQQNLDPEIRDTLDSTLQLD